MDFFSGVFEKAENEAIIPAGIRTRLTPFPFHSNATLYEEHNPD